MEYRGIEYTVVRDERGDWQWAVSLGNPATIKSGHATSKGAAVIKVWAAIDRTHRKESLRSRPEMYLAHRKNPKGLQGHSGEAETSTLVNTLPERGQATHAGAA